MVPISCVRGIEMTPSTAAMFDVDEGHAFPGIEDSITLRIRKLTKG